MKPEHGVAPRRWAQVLASPGRLARVLRQAKAAATAVVLCCTGFCAAAVRRRARGKVSWLSPVAKALLNSRAGDVVVLTTPKGDEELEVLRVIYEGDGA